MEDEIKIGQMGGDPEFTRTFNLGKIAFWGEGRKVNAVTVEVSLRKCRRHGGLTIDGQPCASYIEFSASGNIWNSRHSDTKAGGQCLDQIAERAGQLNNPKLFRTIYQLWGRWHLNSMHAGTREQHAIIDAARAKLLANFKAAGYIPDKGFFGGGLYGYKRGADGRKDFASGTHAYTWAGHKGYYEWECAVLQAAGKYEVPFGPERPNANGVLVQPMYRFGEAWLIDPLDAEAWAAIYDLMASGDHPAYKERLDAWLAAEEAVLA